MPAATDLEKRNRALIWRLRSHLAAAFDKVYEQYRLAPEVTRRRMYYETMERVLSNVDKTIIEAPGVTPSTENGSTASIVAEP